VAHLKQAIKNELSNQLKGVDANNIILRRHGGDVDLEPDLTVDDSFRNTAKIPIQVIIK